MCSSSSPNRDELFLPEMEGKHTIQNISTCSIQIQPYFSLNRAIKKEPNKNIFECQTLNPWCSLNMQPNYTIQSSLKPAKQDLSKAYHDFANGEIRNLTKVEEQWWFRCCLAVEGWNRWSFKFQMMNGARVLAQQSLKPPQSRSAMDMLQWNSCNSLLTVEK